MFKEVKMYTTICDGCGYDVGDDAEYSCHSDKRNAWGDAEQIDFIKHDNKHYCTDCYTRDEKTAEIIIK